MSVQVVGPTALAAANATVELDSGIPYSAHAVVVQGTYTGLTLILEASCDGGVTWIGIKLNQTSTAGTIASDVISANGHYSTANGVVLQKVRARATAIASGSALVSLMAA